MRPLIRQNWYSICPLSCRLIKTGTTYLLVILFYVKQWKNNLFLLQLCCCICKTCIRNRHPISCPHRRATGCLLWGIWENDRVITAPHCISHDIWKWLYLRCFVVITSSVFSGLIWYIYPYSSGMLHWYWSEHTIDPNHIALKKLIQLNLMEYLTKRWLRPQLSHH